MACCANITPSAPEGKFELTGNVLTIQGKTLHQIRALRDISTNAGLVKDGDFGGYIDHQMSIASCDESWVFPDSFLCGAISGTTTICNSTVLSERSDRLHIKDSSITSCHIHTEKGGDMREVTLNACRLYVEELDFFHSIFNETNIVCNTKCIGHNVRSSFAKIIGPFVVKNQTLPCTNITGMFYKGLTQCVINFGPFGKHDRTLVVDTFTETITAGCFKGTLREFKQQVDAKYQGEGNYYDAIKMIEALFSK